MAKCGPAFGLGRLADVWTSLRDSFGAVIWGQCRSNAGALVHRRVPLGCRRGASSGLARKRGRGTGPTVRRAVRPKLDSASRSSDLDQAFCDATQPDFAVKTSSWHPCSSKSELREAYSGCGVSGVPLFGLRAGLFAPHACSTVPNRLRPQHAPKVRRRVISEQVCEVVECRGCACFGFGGTSLSIARRRLWWSIGPRMGRSPPAPTSSPSRASLGTLSVGGSGPLLSEVDPALISACAHVLADSTMGCHLGSRIPDLGLQRARSRRETEARAQLLSRYRSRYVALAGAALALRGGPRIARQPVRGGRRDSGALLAALLWRFASGQALPLVARWSS